MLFHSNALNSFCQALEEARQEKAALEACAAEHAAATGRKDFAASLGMMQVCPTVVLSTS